MSRVKKRRNASPHKDRPTEALPPPRQLPHRSVDQWWTSSTSASLTRAAPSRASPPLVPHHVPEDLIERERPSLFPDRLEGCLTQRLADGGQVVVVGRLIDRRAEPRRRRLRSIS